ncbi:hypothetical protein [Mycobacterium attenuatum]|uniref:hypothetical protein n=1 Tax=Mycobacterium attenuatum TaxID=2341086 RepID=UPI001459FDA1|nr:hypothetical protein [Mycobacterium attenuatum]
MSADVCDFACGASQAGRQDQIVELATGGVDLSAAGPNYLERVTTGLFVESRS